jgi:transcriptional regulator with XRE-family HTH domain
MAKTHDPVAALREWLYQKRETQTWLAEQLGISGSFLSDLLHGKRVPSLRLAARIEKLTGIPAIAFATVEADR